MLPATMMDRITALSQAAAAQQLDWVLLTPGPDLRYLTGYAATDLERLTCLAVPAHDPHRTILLAPALEEPAAQAALAAADLTLEVHTWDEREDPYAFIARLCQPATAATSTQDADSPTTPARLAVATRMWASKLLALQDAFAAGSEFVSAEPLLAPLRWRKSTSEIAALVQAGAAIDAVHEQVPALLQPGKTEEHIAREIATLILDAGHAQVDFIIVAAGENGASPHHEPSSRVLQHGDVVVVDIGGTMPSGYCSDCTRTYVVGSPAEQQFIKDYEVLLAAQEAGVAAVRPGATCADIDRACREVLTAAGLGEFFIHRTGHGIGLETHEPPYLYDGNDLPLAPGMVFSVEPGFYRAGRYGARIEDIVYCDANGYGVRLNHQPRELVQATGT